MEKQVKKVKRSKVSCHNEIYSYIDPIIIPEFERLRETNPYRVVLKDKYLIGTDLVALLDQQGVFANPKMTMRTKLGMLCRAVNKNPKLVDIVKVQLFVVDKYGKKKQPAAYRLMTFDEIKIAATKAATKDEDNGINPEECQRYLDMLRDKATTK